MLHLQHFAYMPIEEVMKQFHATKVSVMEATRACTRRPASTRTCRLKKRWIVCADEQMLKLKESGPPLGGIHSHRRDAVCSSVPTDAGIARRD